MKKILCILAAVAVFAGSVRADEGMWMLPLLQKMNSKAMKDLGCKLSAKQIYDMNNSSLKDAIVQFGGGCTGEIISSDGLLITNHHCGYGSIQKLSSVEHDYLKDGYWAMNRSEELPCEGLTVTFLEYMKDVTESIEKASKKAMKKYRDSTNVEELAAKAAEKAIEEMVADAKKRNPDCNVDIVPFYNDNVIYLIVSKEYKDVRFVGAPPSSIGKFGADTDNWMWPRHTGDFSMFRVYAGKNNKPAEYSPANVPLRTRNSHLKISIAGIEEGDYTMIMGYPGRTTRFQTSPELKFQIEQNDIRIAARTVRQEVMLADMLADPKVKIQYASKYSSSTNGWKKWQGMKLAFDKLNIIGRAEQEENAFSRWVNENDKRKAKYETALDDLANGVAAGRKDNLAFTTAYESIFKIELTTFALSLSNMFSRNVVAGKDSVAALNDAMKAVTAAYDDYSVATDRKVAKAMMKFYRENAAPENYPAGLSEDFATMDIDAFVDNLFDSSDFTSKEKLEKAVAEKGTGIFEDPACAVGKSIYAQTLAANVRASKSAEDLAAARKTYTAGLLEWKKGEP